MKIFIIDIIGSHSGMHYYDRSFRNILLREYKNVIIISNYSDKENCAIRLFKDYYSGNTISKIFKVLASFFRYFFFIIKNRSQSFIFLTFGNFYELIFIFPLLFTGNLIIDAHELYPLDCELKRKSRLKFRLIKYLYKHYIKTIIFHSAKTGQALDKFGYSQKRLFIPHFSYDLQCAAINGEISVEVKSLFSESRINVLFFGNIRMSKGVDILLDIAYKCNRNSFKKKINFIIAGNDPHKLTEQLLKKYKSEFPVSVLLRYINDEELGFIFGNCDYVFLPYRKISQSGVMEMAIRFRKPVITSDLQYFKEILEMFPSFGYLCKSNEYEEYLKLFKKIIELNGRDDKEKFYTESDLEKFNGFKDPENFLNELGNVLSQVL